MFGSMRQLSNNDFYDFYDTDWWSLPTLSLTYLIYFFVIQTNYFNLLLYSYSYYSYSNLIWSQISSSQVFGLDDNASVVKMIYTILARHELLELLSYGMHPTPAETTPTPADKTEMTLDELSKKIEEKINKDPFMTEQAPSVISLKELADPEGMFSGCSMAADIQDIEAYMMKRIANSKTAVAALRRTMKDTGTRQRLGIGIFD